MFAGFINFLKDNIDEFEVDAFLDVGSGIQKQHIW